MSEPANKSNSVLALGILVLALIVGSSAYSVLALAGFMAMTWSIFFGWLFMLSSASILWLMAFWNERSRFPISRQVAMYLWSGVAVWYWSFAPVYYFFNIQLDSLQLSWTAFEYFWEVPIIGGLFVLACVALFRPIKRFSEDGVIPVNPSRLYARVLEFPLATGILIFIFTFIGYALGTAQNAFFGHSPLFEQFKTLTNGVVISLFLGLFFYLSMDSLLGPIRLKIENRYALVNPPRRKIFMKILGLSLVTAIGSMMLISLFVVKSFQTTVREDMKTRSGERIARALEELSQSADVNEHYRIINNLRTGPRGEIMLLDSQEALPEENFSEETVRAVQTRESGTIHDLRGDIKLVSFFYDPVLGKKAVSVIYLTDFYGNIIRSLVFLALMSVITIIIIAVIAAVFSKLITVPIAELSRAVKDASIPPYSYKAHISTSDEFEDLSHAFAHFASEAHRATGALRDERARLLTAINNLSLGFAFFNLNKSLIIKNDSVDDILGSRIKDMNDISKLIPSADIVSVCDRSVETLSSVELKNISFGGKFLRIMVQPILERLKGADKAIGFVVLIEDATHAYVAERTKDEFFTMASHELRTPLTIIRGNMAMMRSLFAADMAGNKDLKKMVDDTYKASVGLIRMVNDFLNIATLEQKGFTFKKEKVKIPELVREIVAELEPVAKIKNLYLKFLNPDEPVPEALADLVKSKEVLFNIISNAINYTDTGGITIRVGSRLGKVEVTIEDTGLGISAESQMKLFNRFQSSKEDILVRDTTKGTGLGLYISRLLTEGMGGELNLVKSGVGVGSVFSFVLPV